jgi:hypothetical protein
MRTTNHRRDHNSGRQQRRRTTALFSIACAVALFLRQYAPRPGLRGGDVAAVVDRRPGGVGVVAVGGGGDIDGIEMGDIHRRTQLWPSAVPADEDGDGDGDDDDDDAEEGGAPLPTPAIMSSYGYIPRPPLHGPVGGDDEFIIISQPRGVIEVAATDIVDHSDYDADADADDADDAGIVTHARLIDEGMPLPPYAIDDAVRTSRMYDNTYALLAYDPERDVFFLLYSKRHTWIHAGNKLLTSFRTLTYFMRKVFPERFQGAKSDELGELFCHTTFLCPRGCVVNWPLGRPPTFRPHICIDASSVHTPDAVIPISSGDYPSVKVECLDHFREHRGNDWINRKSKATCGDGNPAPILHFGSVFRQPHMFPNMIGMPMPAPEHLDCLEKWVIHGEVCPKLRARSASDVDGEFVYGDQFGLTWEVNLMFFSLSNDYLFWTFASSDPPKFI